MKTFLSAWVGAILAMILSMPAAAATLTYDLFFVTDRGATSQGFFKIDSNDLAAAGGGLNVFSDVPVLEFEAEVGGIVFDDYASGNVALLNNEVIGLCCSTVNSTANRSFSLELRTADGLPDGFFFNGPNGRVSGSYSLALSTVPLPASGAVLMTGLFGLGALARRRRRAAVEAAA